MPKPAVPQLPERPGTRSSHLTAAGADFRVWAPFADAVAVAGTFNDWSPSTHAMTSDGVGGWSVHVPGAKAGDAYKFVIRNGARELWRVNPWAREVSDGNAVLHRREFDWAGDTFRSPTWNELVIYEMHVGTFNDAPGGEPGTFDDAIARLPYLADLGVNVIEIMPVLEFPLSFSWGYNPSHPFAVESSLGGPQGLQRFVKAAHGLGLGVIFDVVFNHFGPGDLDLWQFDGWSVPGHDGGIYFYDNARAATPWGHTRPDYGRPEVRQFLHANALHWLEKYHLDGLRFDATAYIRNVDGQDNDPGGDLAAGWTLLQWINTDAPRSRPGIITIAEDLRNNDWITRPAEDGGAGFGAQWDSEFVHPVRAALITPDDQARDLASLERAIYHRYSADAFRRVIYTESHDEVANGHQRVPSEISPIEPHGWFAKKRSTLGAALVFTAPGIPMIFQGQEFLEDAWFRDDDPLDWAKLVRFAGIHRLYRDLIRLRRNLAGFTRGLTGQHVHVFHRNDADGVLALHRWRDGGPGDDVVVVLNFANRGHTHYELGLPRQGRWRVRFNSDWHGYDAGFQTWPAFDTDTWDAPLHNLTQRGAIGLGPYTAVILSQDS